MPKTIHGILGMLGMLALALGAAAGTTAVLVLRAGLVTHDTGEFEEHWWLLLALIAGNSLWSCGMGLIALRIASGKGGWLLWCVPAVMMNSLILLFVGARMVGIGGWRKAGLSVYFCFISLVASAPLFLIYVGMRWVIHVSKGPDLPGPEGSPCAREHGIEEGAAHGGGELTADSDGLGDLSTGRQERSVEDP